MEQLAQAAMKKGVAATPTTTNNKQQGSSTILTEVSQSGVPWLV